MTITTTIEVRAVVTVVESPGQTGARQADGAPLEPSLEREARIESVELPDAEGAGLRWTSKIPTEEGPYWMGIAGARKVIWAKPCEISQTLQIRSLDPMECVDMTFEGVKRLGIEFTPIQLPCHATPAHLPVESISPTDAQRIMRLAEREEVL